MSSDHPDCLTSLVSYVSEVNFGYNLPSVTGGDRLAILTTNQVFLF